MSPFEWGTSGANLLCWPAAGLRFVCGPWPYFSGVPLEGQMLSVRVEGHLSRNCPQRAGYRAADDVGEPDPPCLPWWPLRPSRTYVITVRFPLTDIA